MCARRTSDPPSLWQSDGYHASDRDDNHATRVFGFDYFVAAYLEVSSFRDILLVRYSTCLSLTVNRIYAVKGTDISTTRAQDMRFTELGWRKMQPSSKAQL